MTAEIPESDDENRRFRAALDWLAQQPRPHDIGQVNEACQRFLLSPLDENFLIERFLRHNDSFEQR